MIQRVGWGILSTGKIAAGFAEAEIMVERSYRTACEIHTPMEPHGSVARWDGNRLTIWDSTQGVYAVQGGVAQGVGAALLEQYVYDENAQPLVSTFMDYLMPLATDMPKKLEIIHNHAESSLKLNPLGIKGVGEAGAIPPGNGT